MSDGIDVHTKVNVIVQGRVDEDLFLEGNVVVFLHFKGFQGFEDNRKVLFGGA